MLTIPLTNKESYIALRIDSNLSYRIFDSLGPMALWKSGLFPFNLWYSVNWLTHNISSLRSDALLAHLFWFSSSKSRKFRIFLALQNKQHTDAQTAMSVHKNYNFIAEN